MPEMPNLLKLLAERYQQNLASDELNSRLGHHIAHLAPEAWLAHELAWLVNNECDSFAMEGWSAKLERQRVDVTLYPPCNESAPVYLELKLVTPAFWSNWFEVYKDLGYEAGDRRKPKADYAICFLISDTDSPTGPKQRASTMQIYSKYLNSIPEAPGPISPLTSRLPLYLAAPAPRFPVRWTLPNGQIKHESRMQILWVCVS